MGVSENSGTPKSSICNRVFHYFHHPFCCVSLIFGNTQINDIETRWPDAAVKTKVSSDETFLLFRKSKKNTWCLENTSQYLENKRANFGRMC